MANIAQVSDDLGMEDSGRIEQSGVDSRPCRDGGMVDIEASTQSGDSSSSTQASVSLSMEDGGPGTQIKGSSNSSSANGTLCKDSGMVDRGPD